MACGKVTLDIPMELAASLHVAFLQAAESDDASESEAEIDTIQELRTFETKVGEWKERFANGGQKWIVDNIASELIRPLGMSERYPLNRIKAALDDLSKRRKKGEFANADGVEIQFWGRKNFSISFGEGVSLTRAC
ncbi:MAG: hypothetical protein COX62_08085 [Deltaproteobacteria bacterium CG_4_10_14_0_2_um_filter_43_8]|nr:MAG: hypothetical protein COV43_06575 [Deltaproteobacteria bacterium CG11_big_fil_rev_8_21_14_0_20_42_23]PJA18832.1 MAG: hypothetical protein COX62_08085 [Deltaproteobacteria bacterium CG_4_10_14_0_2_um_filter_43_8]PJC64852.1 MAG: hypothetical protein CO021_02215 [Deltaproteobacteria bacterium CG_4_9_14_0_2_um_filter_42_21]